MWLLFLQMLTSFYIIWHTVYWVNLQYICSAATLPWETSQVHIDGNFRQCYQPKLHNTLSHTVQLICMHNQSEFKFSYATASVQNVLIFHPRRPEVSSAIRQYHRPDCCATSYVMCQSSAVSDQSRLKLSSDTHTSLHHVPYSTLNRTKIRTIQRPKVRIMNLGVSRWMSSITWWTWFAGAMSCHYNNNNWCFPT